MDGSQTGLEALLRLWRTGALATPPSTEALGEAQDDALWRMAEGGFALWRDGASRLADTAQSLPGKESILRLLDPRAWAHPGATPQDPDLMRFLSGPDGLEAALFGRAGIAERREYRALSSARATHRRLILVAWMRAAEAWGQAQQDDPALSARESALRWAEAAGREMEKLHADPKFLDSLRTLLSAAADLRAVEGAMVSDWLARQGLPTRADLDDLAEDLANLRRELAALRRGE